MRIYKVFYILFVLAFFPFVLSAQTKLELLSPNQEIKVSLHISDKIYYSISYNNEPLLQDNYLLMRLRNEVLGLNPKLSKHKITRADEILSPVIPLKFSTVHNKYNQLRMDFAGNYAVEFPSML